LIRLEYAGEISDQFFKKRGYLERIFGWDLQKPFAPGSIPAESGFFAPFLTIA
jgi:hypothetical protein